LRAEGSARPPTSVVVRALYDQFAARYYVGMRLYDYYYPDFGHVPMDAPSFRHELGLLPK